MAAPVAAAAPPELEALLRSRGIPAAQVVVAFAADADIETFARNAVAGETAARPRAMRLYEALLRLKRQRAIRGDRDNAPKARAPKTAAVLLRAAQDPGASDRDAGCYELSALFVAAARAVGLPAIGVEREAWSGTGQIGHVMAAARLAEGAPLQVFDLQNETTVADGPFRELDDLELAAHHYNHLSVAAYLRRDYAAAVQHIDWALALAPASASFHNNRATALAALGETSLAIAEATHAVELAPAVPLFRYQLGRLHLAAGDLRLAIGSLRDALALRPRYGLARRDLGWAHLLAGDVAAAEVELRGALGAEPETPDADLYLGLFLMATAPAPEAGAALREAGARHPDDAGLRALAQLAAGRGAGDPEVERLRQVLHSVRDALAASAAR